MKFIQNSFIISMFLILTCILAGCSEDSTVTPSVIINVNGKVADRYGVPKNNINVLIGSEIAVTNSQGIFSANHIQTPYDVTVLDSAEVIIVKALNRPDPVITSKEISLTVYPALKISVPQYFHEDQITAFFNDNTGTITGYGLLSFNTDTGTISVHGNQGQTVTGNLYLLQYYYFSVVGIFKKFAHKQVTFTIGAAEQQVNFAAQDFDSIYQSPPVTFSVNNPLGYVGVRSDLYINFGNQNNLNLPGGYISYVLGAFNIPQGVFTPQNTNMLLTTTNPATQKLVVLTPGASNSMTIDAVPALIYPPDGTTDVTYNTDFSYSDGYGRGIHRISISNSQLGRNFTIYTRELTFRIPDLSAYGFSLGHGAPYNWNDTKIVGFTYTDDMCADNYFTSNNYSETLESISRTFTTR